jgi:short-subunit dehydrogenase
MNKNSIPFQAAFITGASSGLGRALSLWFTCHGVKVFAAARRYDRLISLRDEAPARMLEPVELDITQTSSAIATMQAIDERCGIDLVIANAGVSNRTHGTDLTWEKIERTLAVNVQGSTATLLALLPRMVERRHGSLVAIGSIAGFRGLPKHAAYSGSKSFLMSFTDSLRIDLEPIGVRVTCAYPGFFKSELTAKNRFRMPFLLETEDAANRIARAVVKGDPTVQFPWQLAWPARAGRLFPSRIYDALMRQAPDSGQNDTKT